MKTESGQILNEAVVSLGIVTIGVVAVFGFLSKAINHGRYVADLTTAVNLSAEAVEVAKNILDANAFTLGAGGTWKDGGFNVDGYYELDYQSRTLTELRPKLASHDLSDYLSFDVDTGLYSYRSTPGAFTTTYKRTLYIENISDDQMKFTGHTTWLAQNRRLSEVSVSTDVFNWRK